MGATSAFGRFFMSNFFLLLLIGPDMAEDMDSADTQVVMLIHR